MNLSNPWAAPWGVSSSVGLVPEGDLAQWPPIQDIESFRPRTTGVFIEGGQQSPVL